MKLLKAIILLFIICCNWTLFAQLAFEGTLSAGVTMAGVDMSMVTEKIDYEKGVYRHRLQRYIRRSQQRILLGCRP